jgi:hypothetical protein
MKRAGAGTAVITPPLPFQLAGHRGERIATGIADELEARALVVQDRDRFAALISVDLLWLSRDQVARIRAIVEQDTGIPARAVFVACTHTHSGPDTLDWYDHAPPAPDWWIESLCRSIASAVYIAHRALQPADIRHDVTDVAIGMNRRLRTAAGMERHPNPDGDIDHSLDVVSVLRPDGGRIATLLRQATHPVILGAASTVVSGDWCGAARRFVESQLGGACLVFNGSCGDVNPIEWTGATLDDVQRVGLRVGAATVEAALRPQAATPIDLFVSSRTLRLDAHPHPYLGRAQQRRLERDGAMLAEVQTLRLGSTVLIGLPGECLTDSARAIRAAVRDAAGDAHALVVGYANDYLGYLPSPGIVEQGGYEARTRMLTADGIAELLGAATDAACEAARQPRG